MPLSAWLLVLVFLVSASGVGCASPLAPAALELTGSAFVHEEDLGAPRSLVREGERWVAEWDGVELSLELHRVGFSGLAEASAVLCLRQRELIDCHSLEGTLFVAEDGSIEKTPAGSEERLAFYVEAPDDGFRGGVRATLRR